MLQHFPLCIYGLHLCTVGKWHMASDFLDEGIALLFGYYYMFSVYGIMKIFII